MEKKRLVLDREKVISFQQKIIAFADRTTKKGAGKVMIEHHPFKFTADFGIFYLERLKTQKQIVIYNNISEYAVYVEKCDHA